MGENNLEIRKEVVFPPPDSKPSCEQPRKELIKAARGDVPTILSRIIDATDRNAFRNAKGLIHIMACELVRRLSELGHPANASESAIHEMVNDGLLTTAFFKLPGKYDLSYMRGAALITTEKFWRAEPTAAPAAPPTDAPPAAPPTDAPPSQKAPGGRPAEVGKSLGNG